MTKSTLGISTPVFHHLEHGKWIVRLATQIWVATALLSIVILTVAYGRGIGALKGTVEDSTEASILEASVALTHGATGKQFSSVTDGLKLFRRVKDLGVSGSAQKADCSREARSQ